MLRILTTLTRITAQLWRIAFGLDIFISYGRSDASAFALALGNDLVARGFTVFIDQLGTSPGKAVPKRVLDQCSMASALVILATEGSVQSEAVRDEILQFPSGNRPVIVIDVGSNLQKAGWRDLVLGATVHREQANWLLEGKPSPALVALVAQGCKFRRQESRQKRLALGTAAVSLCLALTAAWLGVQVEKRSVELSRSNDLMSVARADITTARDSLASLDTQLSETRGDLTAAQHRTSAAQQRASDAEGVATRSKQLAQMARAEADRELRRAAGQRLANEAALAVAGRSGESWSDGVKKLLVARALGAEREADAQLANQLNGTSPSLSRMWGINAKISNVVVMDKDPLAFMALAENITWTGSVNQSPQRVAPPNVTRDASTAVKCFDSPACLLIGTDWGRVYRVTEFDSGPPKVSLLLRNTSVIDSMLLLDRKTLVLADGAANFSSRRHLNAYSTSTGELLWESGDSTSAMASCATPGYPNFATGNREGEIHIRDKRTGEIVKSWRAGDQSYFINAIAFDPTCTKIIVAWGFDRLESQAVRSAKHQLVIWNIADIPVQIGILTGHTSPVMSLAISGDGQLAVSGSRDGQVRLWGLQYNNSRSPPLVAEHMYSHDPQPERPLAAHLAAIVHVEFAGKDGGDLITASEDGQIRFWRLNQKAEDVARAWSVRTAYSYAEFSKALLVSSQNDAVVIGHENGQISEYSLRSGVLRPNWPKRHSTSIAALRSDPAEKWLILAAKDGDGLELMYEIRDWATKLPVGVSWKRRGFRAPPYIFSSAPDLYIECDWTQTVTARSIPNGTVVAQAPVNLIDSMFPSEIVLQLRAICPKQRESEYDQPVFASTRGLHAAPGFRNIQVRDLRTGASSTSRRFGSVRDGDDFAVLGFSDSSDRLVSATKSGLVQVWDPALGREAEPPQQFPYGEPISLAITTAGDRVVVLSGAAVQVFVTSRHEGATLCRWLPEPISESLWTEWIGNEIAFEQVCGLRAAGSRERPNLANNRATWKKPRIP